MDTFPFHYIAQILIWLGFFSTIFFSYYYYLKFRNKERMLLIEKNFDLSEFYNKSEKHIPWFMIGFTLLGVGVGSGIGNVGATLLNEFSHRNGEIALMFFISVTLLFGALGIIIGNSIEQKKKKLRG